MPRILEPVTAVKTDEVEITEFAGNASSGQAGISIASVVAKGGWAEVKEPLFLPASSRAQSREQALEQSWPEIDGTTLSATRSVN